MARAVGTTKATSRTAAPTKARKPPVRAVTTKAAAGKRTAAKTPGVPPKATRPTPASSRRNATPPVLQKPMVSKDDLRAQVAKLENTIATLRTRSRKLTRSAKQASARIAELETQLASTQAATPPVAGKPAKAARGTRAATGSRRRPIDPGDAVPPGVAVMEPEPPDEEARAAKDALTSHLSGE